MKFAIAWFTIITCLFVWSNLELYKEKSYTTFTVGVIITLMNIWALQKLVVLL